MKNPDLCDQLIFGEYNELFMHTSKETKANI